MTNQIRRDLEKAYFKPSKRLISNDWGYLIIEHFFIFLVSTVLVFFVPWMTLNSNKKNWIPDLKDMSDPLAFILANQYIWIVASLVIGGIITTYFIFKKINKKEVVFVSFDDTNKKIDIGMRKYFDKRPKRFSIKYPDLNFSHEIKKRTGERGYKFKIEFFNNKQIIATLNSANSIWQLRKDQEQLGQMINKLKRVQQHY